MGRRKLGARAVGPYEHYGQWRVRLRGPGDSASGGGGDGESRSRSFPTRALAEIYVAEYNAEHAPAGTVGEALDEYQRHLVEKGNKPRSYLETLRRIRRMLPVDVQLDELTPAGCAEAYAALAATLAPDSHRNYLAETRTFLRWCVERRWLRSSPLEQVRGSGPVRRRGKPQLRIDEARTLVAHCLRVVDTGTATERDGAISVLMALLLGLRAGEITERQVRDIDDVGHVIWIPASKTRAGVRSLEIPAVLRPILLERAQGRAGEEPLLGEHWRDWPSECCRRLCLAAGVPVVSAHGLRGTHASLAVDHGATGHVVAASLGHESYTTTTRAYATPEAVEGSRQRRVGARLEVIPGGISGPNRSRTRP